MLRIMLSAAASVLAAAPTSAQVLYETPFDDDVGWTFVNLEVAAWWDVDATPPIIKGGHSVIHCGPETTPAFVSAPFSLNFNNGEDVGGAHDASHGHATSPPIDLNGTLQPELRFQSATCQADFGCDYDVPTLLISNDGFQTILFEQCIEEVATLDSEWEELVFALEPDWGLIELRFDYDTVDSLWNDGAGWFIDDLVVSDCAPVPANYCIAAPNSASPTGAVMGYNGTHSVGQNNLRLHVDGCPPNQLSLFLYSQTQTQFPAGNGYFCLGGPFYRLYPASATGPGGTPSKNVDVTSPALGTPAILIGSVWNFTNWYRDPAAGGALYNFSDGLQVTFCE